MVIDVETLKTLPKRELIAAFGEIIKHGVISGRKYFDFVTMKKPAEFSKKELIEIIKQSIKIKLNIIKNDPKEITGLRRVLNFGHTIGHAVESLSWKTNKPLLHGEAIAIGMVAESNLASSNCVSCTAMLSEKDFELIKRVITNAGLPTKIKEIESKDIMKMILSDKKNLRGKINFSLPKRIGEAQININVAESLIIKAIESVII